MNNNSIAFPDIPFDIYNIDRNYITKLRNDIPEIVSPDSTTVYIGPVMHKTKNNTVVPFFVPVDMTAVAKKNGHHILLFSDGMFDDCINFYKMIPCVNTEFLTVNDTDNDYREFIKRLRTDLYACAITAAEETEQTDNLIYEFPD